MNMIDWFGSEIPLPEKPVKPDKNTNPCVTLYGSGPEGKTCSDCALLVGICKAKTYYKCTLRQNTNSPASDHRTRWLACGKFEQRTKDIPLYDGRG